MAIEPLLAERVDIAGAHVAYTLASLMGKPKDGGRFKLEDFLPRWEPENERIERMKRAALAQQRLEEAMPAFEQAVRAKKRELKRKANGNA